MSDVALKTPETPAQWIASLQKMPRKQFKGLFWDAPTPRLDEFDGEYQGLLLNQGGPVADLVTRHFINREGRWLGKAFRPLNDTVGEGYNLFHTRNGIRRCLRMHLRLREVESRTRLFIEYGDRNDGIVGQISDEVRRLAPGVFVGIGNVPLGGRLLPRLKRRVMFAMVGPVAAFRADAADADVFDEDDTFVPIAA